MYRRGARLITGHVLAPSTDGAAGYALPASTAEPVSTHDGESWVREPAQKQH
jgi:hypothetical protein